MKKMKNDKDVFIEKYGDAIVSIDFGHKDDVTVETVFRKDKSRLTILSQKIVGHTDDFNTEKKRIFKDKRLLSPK